MVTHDALEPLLRRSRVRFLAKGALFVLSTSADDVVDTSTSGPHLLMFGVSWKLGIGSEGSVVGSDKQTNVYNFWNATCLSVIGLNPFLEIPSDESKVHIEVLSVLWENRLPISDGSLPLSSKWTPPADVVADVATDLAWDLPATWHHSVGDTWRCFINISQVRSELEAQDWLGRLGGWLGQTNQCLKLLECHVSLGYWVIEEFIRCHSECMTRSSTKELLSPFKNPKQKFRSKRRLFDTPSLENSNSPEFGS
ncbi:hypothetical protein Tco_0790965 [Tanacetum coccineum]